MPISNDTEEKFAFYSPLAAKLQTKRARQGLAASVTVFGTILSALPAYLAWLFISPETAGVWFTLLAGAGAVCAFSLERLLFMSIQTALPIAGQPYDERQQQLFTVAQIAGRKFMCFSMLALVAIGLTAIYGVATAVALSMVVPLYVWISAALLFISYEFPYLILAWRMPEEKGMDDE